MSVPTYPGDLNPGDPATMTTTTPKNYSIADRFLPIFRHLNPVMVGPSESALGIGLTDDNFPNESIQPEKVTGFACVKDAGGSSQVFNRILQFTGNGALPHSGTAYCLGYGSTFDLTPVNTGQETETISYNINPVGATIFRTNNVEPVGAGEELVTVNKFTFSVHGQIIYLISGDSADTDTYTTIKHDAVTSRGISLDRGATSTLKPYHATGFISILDITTVGSVNTLATTRYYEIGE